MAVRYRNSFYSLGNILWRVDIYDSTFAGAITTFNTSKEGFSISYKGIEERNDPIMGSECTVFCRVENAAFDSFLTEILYAQENVYGIQVYKAGTLYWTGVLLPDQIQRDDQYYPYDIDLKFTDGLARLKDIDYKDTSVTPAVPYSGRDTIMAHLSKILLKTGIADYYNVNNAYIWTCVHWYESYHTYTSYKDPLNYTDLDHQAFLAENEGDELTYNGLYKYMSCYDVLKQLCLLFNCRIMHSMGAYYFYQVQDMARPTSHVRYYNKSATSQGTVANYSLRTSNAQRMSGGVSKYYPPLHHVQRVYNYFQTFRGGNYIPYAATYLDTALLNTIPGAASGMVGTMKGTIKQNYIDSDPNANLFEFMIKYAVKLEVTIVGVGTKYYLTNKNGYPQWSLTSTDLYFFYSDVYYTVTFSNEFSFELCTPAITADCTGKLTFSRVGYYTPGGTVFTLPTGDSFTWSPKDFEMLITYNGESLNGEKKFKATNITAALTEVNSTKFIDQGKIKAGDGPNGYNITRLRTQNTSLAWHNASAWRVHNQGTSATIHQLAVDQNLKGQKIPVERFNGSFCNVNLKPHFNIIWGGRVLVPLNINVIPAEDTFTGEWFDVIIPVI